MPKRLPDDIALEHFRRGNRERSLKRRERLEAAGNKQLLCWIPATLREALDRLAREWNSTVSETVGMLLEAGIKAIPDPTAIPPPSPVMPETIEERNEEIQRQHKGGVTTGELAERFGLSTRTVQRILKETSRQE